MNVSHCAMRMGEADGGSHHHPVLMCSCHDVIMMPHFCVCVCVCMYSVLCGLANEYCLIYCGVLRSCLSSLSNYTYLDSFVKWKVEVIKFLLLFLFLLMKMHNLCIERRFKIGL